MADDSYLGVWRFLALTIFESNQIFAFDRLTFSSEIFFEFDQITMPSRRFFHMLRIKHKVEKKSKRNRSNDDGI